MDKVDLRIAYVLMVHKNPDQVNMFLQQLLTDEQADIYIHINKKNLDEIEGRLIRDPRILMTSENAVVNWGDVSLVDAMLILLREVVASGKKYDFVCLRSGQDMMVRKGYKEYLAANKGKSFMSMEEIDFRSEDAAFLRVKWPKATTKMYDSLHPCRILRVALRKLYGMRINVLPKKENVSSRMRLYLGYMWFCISWEMAEYMADFIEKNPWYYEAFKDGLVPDRLFFNTLAMDSTLADTVVNVHQTYEYWGSSYKNSNHPVVFTMENIDELEKTDCFFARKFDSGVDREVIEYFMKKIVSE